MNIDNVGLNLLEKIKNNPKELIENFSNIRRDVNEITKILLKKEGWNDLDIAIAKIILEISNSIYNNTDMDILLLEDGIYDLLLEKYKEYDSNFQVGASPIQFPRLNNEFENKEIINLITPVYYISEEEINKQKEMIFPEIITREKVLTRDDFMRNPVEYIREPITKRQHNTSHNHPDLVGTLDKCKFVLTKEAEDREVLDDPKVKVLERDWLFPLLGKLYNQNDIIDIIATIKYDGVSVEADITDHIISARTRGDTNLSAAADITPIFEGYRFPNALPLKEPIGMKFEAIITKSNLEKFNKIKGYNYKNGRTAIIGLLGGSDAPLYRDLITLIPLQTDIKDESGEPLDRLVEIEFLNKYYCRDQLLRYSVISGNYVSALFQIKKFTDEAEYSRGFLPFMYDGVVFEFYDRKIREILGRKNYINKYAMAVKFNPLVRHTIFRGFSYTVGQNGVITPMIHYDPIEFFGSIHTKSTGSSYERFCKLDLNIGDIINVEYTNDVMPYVSKPLNSHNENNHLRDKYEEEMFPQYCPSCGTKVVVSDSGKSAFCTNLDCPERLIKKLANMMDKLNINDFAEERIKDLINIGHVKSLRELYNLGNSVMIEILGEVNGTKLRERLSVLRDEPTPDHILIGSLGFTGLSSKKWKIILSEITLDEFLKLYESGELETKCYNELISINGVGKATIETILNEMPLYYDDMRYICDNFNIIITYGCKQVKGVIRFTGFRDKDLVNKLVDYGYDADDNAIVTKSTDILLIPYEGYNSGRKIEKATKYGVQIIPVDKFLIDNFRYED